MNKTNFTSASVILLLLAQCATVPLTGRKQFTMIPSSQILSLSNDSYAQVLKENKISTNAQYINTVKQVGTNITTAVDFWKRMMEHNQGAPPEFLSTHPSDQTRIDYLNTRMTKALEYYNKSEKK